MDYGSRTRESLRAPYYQPSSSSAAAAASNGYFTDQAMRAGIGGGGVCGRFDPPMDLQNERIRLEIRAREGTQSRIVEENIRRELEFDRVMAARRHEAERFYLPQPQPQPQPQPHHEPRLGERIWPAPLPRYPEVVMYDRFPAPRDVRVVERYELERVPRYPQAGAVDRFQPPARDPRPVFRKKQQLARPLEMRRASGSKLSGTKRKAVATAGVSEYSRPEKWCCKVCKVEASSEKGLKEHYQGKKHKAALEESRGGGGGDKELTGKKTLGDKELTDKKTLGDKELTGNKPLASSKPAQRKVEPVNETKKSTTQQKQSFDTLEGKPRFWCETCKLKCTSQTMLESHLNGKRHKAALDELAGGGIGSAKTADTPAKLDSEKMKLLLELESLKDPQKDEKTEEDEKMKVPMELEAEKTEAPSEMEAKNIEAPSEMEVEKDEKADKKTLGDRELTGKNPLASSKPVQRKVDPVNKIKKSTTQQKQKQSVDTSKGKPLFWCETCKLKCNSQTMLESHLNGKRHKAALDELAGGGIGSAKTADTPTKPDSEKMEVPLELESIKDEKTDVPPKLYPQKNEKTKEDEKMDAPAELESEKTKAPSEMGSEKAENIEAPSEIEVEKADKKTLGDKELTGKKPLASSKPVQQKVEPVNETKKSTIQQKQKQSVDTSEGKPLFWCETCKLKCNSQTMLESHLNGKRHNATLNELAGGGIGSAKTADTPTKLESEKMEVPLELESVKDEKTDVPPKLYPQKDEKTEEDEKIEAPAELEAEKTEAPSSEMEVEMAENIEAPSEMEVEKTENTDAPSEIEAEGNGKPAAAVETEVPAKLEPEKSVKPAAGKANRRPARKRAKRTAVGAESVKKSAAAEEA